ncbi:Fic family protein [Desulfobacula sp.]
MVQLAVIHTELEALHPFLGGNGRLGRMCVPLFIYNASLGRKKQFSRKYGERKL